VSAKSAGTIQGRITTIDYHTGLMTVDVTQGSAKKTYDVLVVPGTNIQGAKDFHTIADLKKGARVEVLMSRHGTTYTAQIIRIL
jgi:cytolysin (calcineurin-like family phosphatase)